MRADAGLCPLPTEKRGTVGAFGWGMGWGMNAVTAESMTRDGCQSAGPGPAQCDPTTLAPAAPRR